MRHAVLTYPPWCCLNRGRRCICIVIIHAILIWCTIRVFSAESASPTATTGQRALSWISAHHQAAVARGTSRHRCQGRLRWFRITTHISLLISDAPSPSHTRTLLRFDTRGGARIRRRAPVPHQPNPSSQPMQAMWRCPSLLSCGGIGSRRPRAQTRESVVGCPPLSGVPVANSATVTSGAAADAPPPPPGSGAPRPCGGHRGA